MSRLANRNTYLGAVFLIACFGLALFHAVYHHWILMSISAVGALASAFGLWCNGNIVGMNFVEECLRGTSKESHDKSRDA